MAKPDILIVDGHAVSWQRLCELRRQQIEAWKKSEARQPALFDLRTDYRPRAERTAAGRDRDPSFLDRSTGRCFSCSSASLSSSPDWKRPFSLRKWLPQSAVSILTASSGF